MKILKNTALLLLSVCFMLSAFAVNAHAEADQSVMLNIQIKKPVLMSISGKKPTKDENENFKSLVSTIGSSPYFALIRDYPELTFWMNDASFGASYSIEGTGNQMYMKLSGFKYTISRHPNYYAPKDMEEQLSNAIKSFTPLGNTMYDKVKSIHDYICSLNTYLSEEKGANYCFSAYGALIDNRSVCEGYAEAFKLLCNYNGIDCILVTGTASNIQSTGSHMWNYVRMDDGNWYAVDCTWDDAGDINGNTKYFLVGSNTVINGKAFKNSHKYTTDFQNMSIDGFAYPSLSKTAYNPQNEKIDYEYSGTKYYYSFLNESQKNVYDAILYAAKNDSFSDSEQTPPDTSDNMIPPQTPPETTPQTTPETTPEFTETDTEPPYESSDDSNESDKTKNDAALPLIFLSICFLALIISRRIKK